MADATTVIGPWKPGAAPEEGGAGVRRKGRKWSHITVHAPPEFHREYKLYAIENGLTMQQLLMESFALFKKSRAGEG